jgi:hypothetical protein
MSGEEKLELDIVELEFDEVDEEVYDEVYDEEEDEQSVEQNIAQHTWGLDSDINLAREAADWYLLMDLWLDKKDDDRFMKRTSRLAIMFSSYADMVIGGELRYTLGHVENPGEVLDDEMTIHLQRNASSDRSEAWDSWSDFRIGLGTSALHMAETAFDAFGESNSYGGPKWAYIVRTLRMYETEEITPITFVDMCWGLEHNGGQFFGKLWSTYSLQVVLDANVQENTASLLQYAHPDITKIYTEVA